MSGWTLKTVIAAGLLLALGACRSPRPASIEDWDACLIANQGLRTAEEGRLTFAEGGEGSVLYVNAEWDRSWIVSEYSFGELLVALPRDLEAGQELPLSGTSQYQEGGQIVSYRSRSLEGTLVVLSISADAVQIELKGRATEPSVDLSKRGEVPLVGRLEVERAASFQECD